MSALFATPLAAMNAALLRKFGETFTYTPAGGEAQTVTCIRKNPSVPSQGANTPFMVLWAPMSGAGFSAVPAKNDTFTKDSITYRVFDVDRDEVGQSLTVSLID